MNTKFHAPSFGDEIFDLGDTTTSAAATSFAGGHSGNMNSSYLYQQTPPTTKRMISLHNTSDEYHTANEESFNVTANNSMNNSIIQPPTNTTNNVLSQGTPTTGPTTMAARKQMLPLDQNEPAKPLSAYALFFRDTVSAIKQQNPSCSFQELSKIVASMWDALDPVHKGVYNKKNEMAKIEYLKQMRIYQQQQQLRQDQQSNETMQTNQTPAETVNQQVTPTATNNNQQNTQSINNNNNNNNNITNQANSQPDSTTANSGAPNEDQISLLTEAGSVQKCTRENCTKRAIINPDWEDEYCSNECVVIHCRNVFNAWVQSNLEAKQQQ